MQLWYTVQCTVYSTYTMVRNNSVFMISKHCRTVGIRRAQSIVAMAAAFFLWKGNPGTHVYCIRKTPLPFTELIKNHGQGLLSLCIVSEIYKHSHTVP